MSRRDPHTLGLTLNGRIAASAADANDRIAALERGGNSNLIFPGSSTSSVGDATTLVKGKLQLAGNLGGTADSPYVLNLRNLETTVMADQVVLDDAHGDLWHHGDTRTPLRYDIRHGTTAAPVTTFGPTLRVARSEYFPSGTVTNGAELNNHVAIIGSNRNQGDSTGMLVGVFGLARNSSAASPWNGTTINTDAAGIVGQGAVIGSGTGAAMGGFFEAQVYTTTAIKCKGVEIMASNLSGVDGTWDISDSGNVYGAYFVLRGNPGGTGLTFRNSLSAKWDVGIHFASVNTGPASDAAIRDDGTSTYSVRVEGTHDYAFTSAATAGDVGFGTSGPTAKLEVLNHEVSRDTVIFRTSVVDWHTILCLRAPSSARQARIDLRDHTNANGWQLAHYGDGSFNLYDVVGAGLVLKTHTGGLFDFTGQLGVGIAASSSYRLKLPAGTTPADGIAWGTDTELYRVAANFLSTGANDTFSAGNYDVRNTDGTSFIQLREQSGTPTTPPNTALKLFARDTAGTTELCYVDNTAGVTVLGAGSSFITSVTDSAHIDHTVTGAALSSTILTTATPQLAGLGIGVSSPATGFAVRTSAMTDRLWTDQTHGDNQLFFGIASVGQRYDIRHGTAAAPVTTQYPTFKISRRQQFVDPISGGDGISPALFGAMEVCNYGTTTSAEQATGIFTWARSESTQALVHPSVSPDALGLHAAGWITGSGVNRGIGLAGQGRTTSNSNGGQVTGGEFHVWNDSTVNGVYDPTGVPPMGHGLLVATQGSANVACGVFIQKVGAGEIDVGFAVSSTNPVNNQSFRDDGNAATSLQINGTHATAAIGIAAASGNVGIGTTTPAARLNLGYTAAGAESTVAADGILWGDDTNLYRSAADTLKTDDALAVTGAFNVTGASTFASSVALTNTTGSGFHTYFEQGSAVSTPTADDRCRVYMRDNKFIVQYNHGGTVKYRYLDLTSTDATWTYTTTAP